jgi:hypothetical protein
MTAPARIAAAVTVLVLVSGCGGGSSSESTGEASPPADSASTEPSATPSSEPSPDAEPSKVPFDRSVLSDRAPTTMSEPIRVISGNAKGTVIAVRPVSLKPAPPAPLAGLTGKDRAAAQGKKAYFLTYKVSYVNGRVESLAPFVSLAVIGADDAPLTPLTGSEVEGCRRADTAGKTFGAGSSYTACSIEVSSSGSKPGLIQYVDYQTPDVRPVWPVR